MTTVRAAIERLGGLAIGGADAARQLAGIFVRTVRGSIFGYRPKGEVVRQMYQVGNRSLAFVTFTIGFVGMVTVYQGCLQIKRTIGDLSQVGPELLKYFVNESGPTLTALMLVTRVGAGIAAEVGSMVVTEQVDALRMCGVDPVDYLIVPRFLASLLMTVVLAIWGVLIAFLAGSVTAWTSYGVNPHLFLDVSKVSFGDVTVGLMKCFAYGAAIPVVSAYCGLNARGGSEGVGKATTAAVIGSSFAVVVLDFILSAVGMVFILGDPA